MDKIKNVFKLLSKKDENKYKSKYKFDNDEDIIKSFKTIFKENDIE